MLKILIILYLLKCTSSVSDDESYEKYIDLLPEKEKEEFLNRIARRLLEEIKSDQVPNQSQVDINDDQLETHDSLVQNIMREETDKLKDEMMQDNSEKTDRIDGNKSEERYIDLTLREGKRQKRKNYSDELIETTSKFDYNVIPVKTITDDAKIDKENDREHFMEAKQQDTHVIPLVVRDTANNNSLENEPTSLNSNKTNANNSKQLLETNETVNEPNNNQAETAIEGDNTEQNSIENIDTMTGDNENSNNENNNSKTYINSTKIGRENKSNITFNTINTESVISSVHEKENKFETPNQNNIKQVENNEKANTTDSDIIITTENSPHLTTASISPSENETRSTKIMAVRKSQKVTINVGNKAHVSKENIVETKTALRLGPNSITDKILENHKKIKEYEVYEVASEKPAFSLGDKKVDKQPNYVPVYNYSPENAYFRPFDRFGPNDNNIRHEIIDNGEYIDREPEVEVDSNMKLNVPNMRSRFIGYNNKQNIPFRPNNHNINKKAKYGIYDYMRPIHRNVFHHNILYNPYDYLDMDYGYNILRKNVKHFPDSNEADHPFNSIHKSDSVKDHIRAVRKLLYLQNNFGYVPVVKNKVRKFNLYKKPTKSDKNNVRLLHDPITDNIAVDYYFGREKSNEEENDSVDSKLENNLENNFELGLKDTTVDRNNFNSFLNDMLQVLEDMVRFDNSALEKYSWLITTVDIQTAIKKLLNLSEGVLYGEYIHPKDIELLKYSLYLFKSSKISLDNKQRNEKQNFRYKPFKKRKPVYKKSRGLLPHNRFRGKIKQPLNFWKDLAKFIRNEAEIKDTKLTLLYEFEDFLQNILFHLNEFHDAIKHISIVTKYDNQTWFKDLKDIYFDGSNKRQLAKVILHISLFDLLEGIEEDAINGADADFKGFVKNNNEKVRRTKEKLVFVMLVLEELNTV